ncbi:hypothetical protein M3Y99_00781300 [Aphelenchoides fujianensis]|nr:hypothetical protein M3Y99_00781300 [Aphelenchoides fujianensis]
MLSARLCTCACGGGGVRGFAKLVGFAPRLQPAVRLLRTDARQLAAFNQPWGDRESVRKRIKDFRMTMSDEEKSKKMSEIEQARAETKPTGLVAKLKFYIKRYWYIAIPVHTINCGIWFGFLYLAVRSGVDVVGLMESLHMPHALIEKIKNTPPSAGFFVVTFLVYKIVMPLRYATTLALIRVTFEVLRKFGWLRTAREVEYSVRSGYETLNKRRLSSASKLSARLKDVKRAVKPPSKSKFVKRPVRLRMSLIRQLGRKMSTQTSINPLSGRSARHMIAVCQLTSTHDLDANFDVCASMVRRAKERHCEMIFFPECFDYVGRNRDETIGLAYSENSPFIQKFRDLARDNGVWLSLGGFHHKEEDNEKLPLNSHLILDAEGKTRAVYNKLHLFDLDLPGKVRLMESEFSRAGDRLVPPVQTPVGKLGLSICYDVRFPELSLWNRYEGAEVLSFPSAFTLNTGLAHWETLMRARAIETQCYVVAAAQTGKHNDKRVSYGHSLVVDPWGAGHRAVLGQHMCFAELNLDYVREVRENQPVIAHRRSDLYSINYATQSKNEESLKFADKEIPASTIFFRSGRSFAFVNLKPIKAGHVLVSPIRPAERLLDLTDLETADLFNTSKRVQRMLEQHFDTQSTTVCIQDGELAGQSVKHVHVHVIPRTTQDFGKSPDGIYKALEVDDEKRTARSLDEMSAEAAEYRRLLEGSAV